MSRGDHFQSIDTTNCASTVHVTGDRCCSDAHAGGREGYFYALDAETGDLLWRTTLGGQVASGPISYAIGGTQYVAAAAGNGLFVFALRE